MLGLATTSMMPVSARFQTVFWAAMFFMEASISLLVLVKMFSSRSLVLASPPLSFLMPAFWLAMPLGLKGAITSPSSDSRKKGMYHSLSNSARASWVNSPASCARSRVAALRRFQRALASMNLASLPLPWALSAAMSLASSRFSRP
ncbi:hypothetical protein D3C75_704770 [compost metagenome]